MTDQAGGASAEVGVRKINGDGEVEQEEGAVQTGPPLWAWLVWLTMLAGDVFGGWKLLELAGLL